MVIFLCCPLVTSVITPQYRILTGKYESWIWKEKRLKKKTTTVYWNKTVEMLDEEFQATGCSTFNLHHHLLLCGKTTWAISSTKSDCGCNYWSLWHCLTTNAPKKIMTPLKTSIFLLLYISNGCFSLFVLCISSYTPLITVFGVSPHVPCSYEINASRTSFSSTILPFVVCAGFSWKKCLFLPSLVGFSSRW